MNILFLLLMYQSSSSLTIGNQSFSLESTNVFESESEYSAAMEISQSAFVMSEQSSEDLGVLTSYLRDGTVPSTGSMILFSNPLIVYLFTIPSTNIGYYQLQPEQVRGYLIISRRGEKYYQLFAKKSTTAFEVQMSQCMEVPYASYYLDTVRGFHHASTMIQEFEMPGFSAIHALKLASFFPINQSYDLSVELNLYLDPLNNVGRFASNFWQGNLFGDYSYMLGRSQSVYEVRQILDRGCGSVNGMCDPDPTSDFCEPIGAFCDNLESMWCKNTC